MVWGNARWPIWVHPLSSPLPACDTKWQLISNHTAKPVQRGQRCFGDQGNGAFMSQSPMAAVCPCDLHAQTSSLCISSLARSLSFWSPGEQQLLFCSGVKPLCFGAFTIYKLQVPLEMILCLPQAYMPYAEKCSYWKPCLWRDVNSLVTKFKSLQAVSLPL